MEAIGKNQVCKDTSRRYRKQCGRGLPIERNISEGHKQEAKMKEGIFHGNSVFQPKDGHFFL
jgi:hypothetical protein